MLNLNDYKIFFDVWEGSLDIDEDVIRNGGVSGLIIRMNTTSGLLYLDKNFISQWNQAKNFAKAPYWVVSPLITADKQFEFIHANMPKGYKTIFLDVEIKRDGVTPKSFGNLLRRLVFLLKSNGYRVVIYTGPWRYDLIDVWPSDVPYWIAGYPYSMYPSGRIDITYEKLKEMLSKLYWIPYSPPNKAATIAMWQVSGDRLMLPGTANRAIDVNLISNKWFDTLFGDQSYIPPPDPPIPPEPPEPPLPFVTYLAIVTAPVALNIREEPNTSSASLGYYHKGTKIPILEESGRWGRTCIGWSHLDYVEKL